MTTDLRAGTVIHPLDLLPEELPKPTRTHQKGTKTAPFLAGESGHFFYRLWLHKECTISKEKLSLWLCWRPAKILKINPRLRPLTDAVRKQTGNGHQISLGGQWTLEKLICLCDACSTCVYYVCIGGWWQMIKLLDFWLKIIWHHSPQYYLLT